MRPKSGSIIQWDINGDIDGPSVPRRERKGKKTSTTEKLKDFPEELLPSNNEVEIDAPFDFQVFQQVRAELMELLNGIRASNSTEVPGTESEWKKRHFVAHADRKQRQEESWEEVREPVLRSILRKMGKHSSSCAVCVSCASSAVIRCFKESGFSTKAS
ncbi:uncharacterized protein LOC135499166 [Lineus longissimus]|uniref:uncharacterized protein LOC135499166 n=1 Tax=Lineus longissimus TaxID=88925 RepID=UPI00315DEAC6